MKKQEVEKSEKIEKNEVGKFGPKLESSSWSWNVWIEFGKNEWS